MSSSRFPCVCGSDALCWVAVRFAGLSLKLLIVSFLRFCPAFDKYFTLSEPRVDLDGFTLPAPRARVDLGFIWPAEINRNDITCPRKYTVNYHTSHAVLKLPFYLIMDYPPSKHIYIFSCVITFKSNIIWCSMFTIYIILNAVVKTHLEASKPTPTSSDLKENIYVDNFVSGIDKNNARSVFDITQRLFIGRHTRHSTSL
jgi:hypothetical protein